jgi:Uma2 family endonuclease
MWNLVRASAKAALGRDPTVYPVEEKMGEDMLQRWIAELLRPLLVRWLDHRGTPTFVGADQFIYYQPHTPTLRVSPDLYVLPGVRPETRVTSWKTWERGIVPSFALEVVSTDWEKDYIEGPERYGEMGIPELIVFDPASSRHVDGVRWQVFRRVAGRRWARVETSDGDRVWSKALGCFLRAVGEGDSLRVRVGTGPRGDELFSTAEEAERAAKEAERAAKEGERAAKEAERAAKEVERAAKEAALERVLELERQLRKLQAEGRRKPRKAVRQ